MYGISYRGEVSPYISYGEVTVLLEPYFWVEKKKSLIRIYLRWKNKKSDDDDGTDPDPIVVHCTERICLSYCTAVSPSKDYMQVIALHED